MHVACGVCSSACVEERHGFAQERAEHALTPQVHYLSKFLDWFDTFFIIAKGNAKKQLSFLHVYHHSSIGLMWGILLATGGVRKARRALLHERCSFVDRMTSGEAL